jgi:hypothetical protein
VISSDPERSARRAAQYGGLGLTGLTFAPTGDFAASDPRQPRQEAAQPPVRRVRLVREAIGLLLGQRAIHRLRPRSIGQSA